MTRLIDVSAKPALIPAATQNASAISNAGPSPDTVKDQIAKIYNGEIAFLAKHALAVYEDRLYGDSYWFGNNATSAEVANLGYDLANINDYAQASHLAQSAEKTAASLIDRTAAYRLQAMLDFGTSTGKNSGIKNGREQYARAITIFNEKDYADADIFTRAYYNINTHLNWAQSEATANNPVDAFNQAQLAMNEADSLP